MLANSLFNELPEGWLPVCHETDFRVEIIYGLIEGHRELLASDLNVVGVGEVGMRVHRFAGLGNRSQRCHPASHPLLT
jgi:hypothetical protein